MKTINKRTLILIILSTLVAGIFLGWLFFGTASSVNHALAVEHDQLWTCSMHPQVRRTESGKCPICGMDLIPLSEMSKDNPAVVKMTETAMKLANVETTIVGHELPVRDIRLTGKVQADERKIYSQPAHFAGRIESLDINFTGEMVRRGQTVATIYSPDLVTAQEELLQAYAIRESQPGLYQAAREKLKNWRLTDKQIDVMLTSENRTEIFPVTADVSGIIMKKWVNMGDYVERGVPLYDVADLSSVWVLFDVYESDMQWVSKGSKVSFTVQSLPGKTFDGVVSFIDPVINPETRTASARIEIKNPGYMLKPEMLATGVIKRSLEKKANELVIPKSAVLWTGERSVVYIKTKTSNGSGFRMREVLLGPEVGDGYIVKDGLEEGTEIVTNGTFSVDAAAQLAGKPSMMNPATN